MTFIITIALLTILAVAILLILERTIANNKQSSILTEHTKTLLEIAEKTCESMLKITKSFEEVLEKQNSTINKILDKYEKVTK